MKTLKITPIVLLFLFVFTASTNAQEKQYKAMVMGMPQYLFTNGLRIDIDVPLNPAWKWLVISPTFYFNDNNEDNASELFNITSYEKLIGAGLDVSSRAFLNRKQHGAGFYVNYGVGYRLINITTNHFLWTPYQEDGLTYYERQMKDYDLNIHSMNGKAVIGLQQEIMPGMFFDIFMGFGIRFSVHDSPEGSFLKYNLSTVDYGYTGTLFVGGFRLGVALD